MSPPMHYNVRRAYDDHIYPSMRSAGVASARRTNPEALRRHGRS